MEAASWRTSWASVSAADRRLTPGDRIGYTRAVTPLGNDVSMRIKICGFTTEGGIDAAVALGVDAIGLVLDPSPRRLSLDRAVALKERVPVGVDVVAVCGRPTERELSEIARVLQPDVIQLMADAALPNAVGSGWLLAFEDGPDLTDRVRRHAERSAETEPVVLVDGPAPGSGITADWSRVNAIGVPHRLIIAGGLTPDNVGKAVQQLRPYGVDVCSGVERSVGVKDPDKMAAFVAAVRAADGAR